MKEPKEKVVTEKKEKVVKEKAVKVVKEKAVKEVKEKAVKEVNEVKVDATQPNEKKARAPGLVAKYGKFIQYSYYLLRAINDRALETSGSVLLDETAFFDAAHVFDNIDNQQAFVTTFLENKNIAKEMRTHIAEKKKAEVAAAKNAEKVAKEAIKAAEKLAKAEAKKAAKQVKEPKTPAAKGKSKKAAAAAVEPDLVTSLVALANSTVVSAPIPVEAPNVADNTEEEEELDVRLFTINGKEYLIDDNNNLYDANSHTVVGTWDKENNTIVKP